MISEISHPANSPEGSNPSLTALATEGDSNKTPTIERFWSKVQKAGPEHCWPWRGYLDRDGYGRFSLGRGRKFAHRIAFFLATGDEAKGLSVCHRCDNRRCQNPAHLFAASHQINIADRHERKRTASGERNGRAKLTAATVRQIRAAYVPHKVTLPMLAERFGVNRYVVQDILRGRTWKAEAAAWRALGATVASISDRKKLQFPKKEGLGL